MFFFLSKYQSMKAIFLKKVKTRETQLSVSAAQPADMQRDLQRDLKTAAYQARQQLYNGERLKRKQDDGRRLNRKEKVILAQLNSGKLLRDANTATRLHGHGRVKNEDGSFEDIGPNTRGLTRTVLDNMEWFEASSSDEDAADDEANDGDSDVPDWSGASPSKRQRR